MSLDDLSYEPLLPHCSKLTTLLAASVRLSNTMLQLAAQYCPELETLDVSGSRRIGFDGCAALVAGCKKLKSLNLTRTGVGDKAMVPILENLKLNELTIEDTNVSHATVECIAKTQSELIVLGKE